MMDQNRGGDEEPDEPILPSPPIPPIPAEPPQNLRRSQRLAEKKALLTDTGTDRPKFSLTLRTTDKGEESGGVTSLVCKEREKRSQVPEPPLKDPMSDKMTSECPEDKPSHIPPPTTLGEAKKSPWWPQY